MLELINFVIYPEFNSISLAALCSIHAQSVMNQCDPLTWEASNAQGQPGGSPSTSPRT